MSDLTDFLSKCSAPAIEPLKKAYRTYRNNVIFDNDFVKIYGPSMPKLTMDQKKELDSFYGRYGFCMKSYYNYYRFLTAANGNFSPRLMFGQFLNKEIIPRFNNLKMSPAWSDKCYLDSNLPGVLVPRTILRNINGHFFDADFKSIDNKCAEKIFEDHDSSLIVKKSILTGGGASITIHKEPSGASKIFEKYKRNFVVQEVIDQHPILSDLNPSSLNTLRIISFSFKGEIHIVLSALRVGAEGSCVDNISSGGVAFGVNNDGRLLPTAREYWGWPIFHSKSETIANNKTVIPSYAKILDIVKEHHPRFPHFGFIAWDVGIDSWGRPVVMEMNLSQINVQPFQEAVGRPFLGDMTEEVLRETSRRDFL